MGRPRVYSDAMILAAARAEFAANGYSQASMEQIAATAGTTKPTLYSRFGGKPELYERTVRDRANALLAHLFVSYEEATELPVVEMIDAAARLASSFSYAAVKGLDRELVEEPTHSRPRPGTPS